MKIITIVLLLSLILSGCNNIESKISEEQAKQIVLEHYTKEIGEVEIISVTTKFNKYIIEWENKENCEKGTDSVNKNGELKMIEASIC
jgi:PBP1b-binding outer membrane lipoprotein LpoB